MKNQQYISGERNHYFYGKLMTVRDFESEQTYGNDKRRLGNRLLHGTGIVSGLGVLMVDNQTFSLEAGMALDYLGREIVVQEPCVKRINTIKGFDKIKEGGDVYLCLAYNEQLCEGTFSVAGAGKGSDVVQQFNRVQEGYELFLTDRQPNPARLGLESVLYEFCTLYDKDGIRLVLQIPKYVNPENSFYAKLMMEKRDVSAPVRFSFVIESDLFRGKNGERTIRVEYNETEVTTDKSLVIDCTMTCGPVHEDYSEIRVPAEQFRLAVGSQEQPAPEKDVECPVKVTDRPLREMVAEAYYTYHFDELLAEKEEQTIYLARLHLFESQNTYFIDRIVRNPFGQYLPNVQLLHLLQGIEKTAAAPVQEKPKADEVPAAAAAQPGWTDQMKSGVETVNLGVSPKVGKSYFSHEFVHGLGAGNICVVVAVDSAESAYDTETLVFGDGVFTAEKFSLAAPACSTAAMVNTKKGTLQLGLRLQEKTARQAIRLRWWAWKQEAQKAREEIADEIQVLISPNTANLEPLAKQRFMAQVEGSASQEINWRVVDKNGGSIDRNGLYTAPATEGVFEIQAQSAKYGNHIASAYVVVGKL